MNGLNDDDNDKTEKLGITLPKPILQTGSSTWRYP